ncbi:Fc.00g048360.m01.CDS01 [Cosmosporella sp. VM-42]
MSLLARLWDRAYDELKQEDSALVSAYEKILSRQLQDGLGSAVPESQPNAIAQLDPDKRRRQMDELVRAGLTKIAPEVKVKEGAGATMEVFRSTKDVEAPPSRLHPKPPSPGLASASP